MRLSCRNTEAQKEDDGKMNVVAEIAAKHIRSCHVKSSFSHRAWIRRWLLMYFFIYLFLKFFVCWRVPEHREEGERWSRKYWPQCHLTERERYNISKTMRVHDYNVSKWYSINRSTNQSLFQNSKAHVNDFCTMTVQSVMRRGREGVFAKNLRFPYFARELPTRQATTT